MDITLKPIAIIRTDFQEKFGIPRQSGLVPELVGRIEFLEEFRSPDAVRGIEDFSHLWLIWGFHIGFKGRDAGKKGWSATVRPPRLGGKVRLGVFATRSPNRPNPIGLSSVRLLGVEQDEKGMPILLVGGADLADGTPIYDIKPYIPYADCHPEASGGFTEAHRMDRIDVRFPLDLLQRVAQEKREALQSVLAQDPRGAYEKKPDYVYGLRFEQYDVRFRVTEGILEVVDVVLVEEEDFRKVKQ